MISQIKPLWREYSGFSGRTTRTEYLVAQLILTPLFWGALWFRFYVADFTLWEQGGVVGLLDFLVWIIQWAMIFVIGYVSLCFNVRRYHDFNLSGGNFVAMALGSGVPYVGIVVSVIVLIFLFLPPTKGENDYGPDPRDASRFRKAEIGKDME